MNWENGLNVGNANGMLFTLNLMPYDINLLIRKELVFEKVKWSRYEYMMKQGL